MVHKDQIDRRSFLKKAGATSGAVAVTGLAGCGGNGEGNGNGDDNGDGTEPETGDQLPEFTYYNNPQDYNPGRHDAINLISEQWRELGLRVDVEVLEWATLLSRVDDEYEFDLATWSQYFGIDPAEGTSNRFSSENAEEPGSGNYHGYQDEEMDELITEQQEAETMEDRVDPYHTIQEKVAEEVPMHPVLVESNMMPHRNDQLSGWVDHLEGYNRLTNYVNVSVEDGNDDGKLRGFWTESLENLNPWAHENLSKHLHLMDAMFEKPLHFTPELEPDHEISLVTDIERPDLETLVWEIRDDASWSDGEDLTAEDVAFTYQTIVDEQPPQYTLQSQWIESAEVVDDTAVQINLTQEIGMAADTNLGNPVYIAPKHIWEDVEAPYDELVEEPVTSGIMELDYWETGEEISLTARDDHRLDFEIEGILWRIIPSTSTIWELTRDGDINYHPFAQANESLVDGEEEDNISVATTAGNGWTHLNINMRNSGLDEQAVRQAMAHAIPKTAINDQLYNGYHEPGVSYLTPSFADLYTDDVMTYDESLESAQQTLEDNDFVVTDDGVYYPAE
ncbi:MAG: ABC transporter substrate-binding protein [Halolamina sp.]